MDWKLKVIMSGSLIRQMTKDKSIVEIASSPVSKKHNDEMLHQVFQSTTDISNVFEMMCNVTSARV